MTAADQPTTEPSVLDEALAAVREYFRITSVAPTEGGVMVPVAHLRALYDALAPAPQPAGDTETEVQWGVRLTGHGGEQHTTPHPTEDSARAEQRLNQKYFEHGDEAWSALWASSAVVRHTRTPWEEA